MLSKAQLAQLAQRFPGSLEGKGWGKDDGKAWGKGNKSDNAADGKGKDGKASWAGKGGKQKG